ncbi:MAG: glycosyltransferase family 4 protein [Rhodospirillales bacterium]|nr:glycosyltransferase family 4 protein [Rhodospirillales bacterium]
MKICQLCSVGFTLYHFLLPLMRAMREAGHEVVGVCGEGPFAERVRAEGFRVEAVGFRRNYDVLHHGRVYGELVRLFRRERFDMVHVHSPIAALIGRLAAARAGVPKKVYTAHGFYFHEYQPWGLRHAFIGLEWIGGRFTDVLFTQSAEDAQAARDLGLCWGGVIEAIGNGVDPARFRPADAADAARQRLRAELGAGSDDVVILMIGRLVAEKGYPELFAAMKDVNARLWVVGNRLKSDHAASVDDAIARVEADPDLSRRISFLGYRGDVDELLRAADIFTLPSHREGMPRSIIEAMMSGLPVVATHIRGSREEVVDGETGFLVPVRDAGRLTAALQRLVTDGRLRSRLGAAGRQRALAQFDEGKVVARQIVRLGLES